ncbi:unnamed protein product [Rotaria socialis]|uniref:Uncharacterized protein n=1 Tax=Rotaria socialis TaxID=392032 RepID=A0A817QPT9_9BILA|nr:unnamed protein product [Rotaria socialis]CAF3486785.1 unnamed protein product [Rotaria socialis]
MDTSTIAVSRCKRFSSKFGSAASPLTASRVDVKKFSSGAWTAKSSAFSRDMHQLDKQYYYQAIEFSVPIMDTYTFTSKSLINTYGSIYDDSFNSSDPTLNLISQDNGSNNKGQFKMNAFLQPGHKYILVATTFSPKAVGKFLIVYSGPAAIKVRSQNQPRLASGERELSGATRATSIFITSLSSSSQSYNRPSGEEGLMYYFQAIQVTVSTAGSYMFESSSSIDTIGYFYNTYFDPSNPMVNLITDNDDDGLEVFQFRIQVYLQTGIPYVLVATTHVSADQGSLSVSATGPGSASLTSITPTTSIPIITLSTAPPMSSSYSGALSSASPVFVRPEGDPDEFYYFQAIQVTVPMAGSYVFRSESDLDTMGYFYDFSFDPSNPSTNLITDDDDNGHSLQFRIQVYLQTGRTYILVVTTHSESEQGSFLVSAFGPATVSLISFTPSTSRPITTQSTVPPISSTYSGSLSTTSPMFSRPDGDNEFFYFQAIQVSVSVSGSYIFQSNSTFDTMGFFYGVSFDPSVPLTNLLIDDDDDGDIIFQFRIQVSLRAGNTYILVVTSHREYEKGDFSIKTAGPSNVGLTSITPSTSRPIAIPTTRPVVLSVYSGSLSSSSSVFYRPEGDTDKYYYFRALRVTVPAAGNYMFESESIMDTMAYFYGTSFDPSSPLTNLIAEDDDDGGTALQFRLQIYLQPGLTYILVVTTHRPYASGNFRVKATGLATVSLTFITPSTSRPILTPTTPTSATQSTYTGALSANSAIFYRPDGGSNEYYYFQAIQVTISTAGFYTFKSNSTIDTRGYFYQNSFDPSNSAANLVTSDDDGGGSFQFRIQVYLETLRTYILVVTTHRAYITGDFSVSANGPAPLNLISITPVTSRPITTLSTAPSVSSSYAGEFSSSSLIFYRPDGNANSYYYFVALQITVSTAGTYIFTSNSTVDTMGYFYGDSFDPSQPLTNLITRNDDGGISLQFRIETFLETGRTYILAVTTHRERIMGTFTAFARGITSATLTPITPSTSRPITTRATTTPLPSSYASSLSSNSPFFTRPEATAGRRYFYQAIEVTIPTTGTYSFKSDSAIDVIGYFYQIYFDPSNPTINLITKEDDNGGSLQFLIQLFLQAGRRYFLVVSTHAESNTGSFSIRVGGPAIAVLASFTPTTTRSSTTVITVPSVLSTYMSALWPANLKFNRPNGDKRDYYYYDAIQITVYTSGAYTFTSKSYFGAVGYLYESSFDPSNPSNNLIHFGDVVGINGEFEIDVSLSNDRTYILVVTSSQPLRTGVFWIWGRGRASLTLTSSASSSGDSTPSPVTTTEPLVTTLKSSASIKTNTITTTITCMAIMLVLQMCQQRLF